jgi:hypothetical protein
MPGQGLGGGGDDVGKVEQHAAQVRVGRQDGREHRSVGAADVHDRVGAVERQGRDRGGLNPPVRFAIAAVYLPACSGWCDSQVKNGSPYRCSAAGWPVRMV